MKGVPFEFADQRSDLATRRISYAGDFVCTREQIRCCLVEPMWPVIGQAAVRPIIDHIEPHLAAEISYPQGCLRPVEDWPSQPPRSCVFAEDHEWFSTIRAAFSRGMVKPVPDSEIVLKSNSEILC